MVLNLIIVALKSLALLLGGAITFFSYRAYRRTGEPALRILAVGFALITLGSFLAGIGDQLLNFDRDPTIVIETTFTVIGFGTLLYSLYVDRRDSLTRSNE